MTTYLRNRTGETVHRAGCRRATSNAVPWQYADGFTADQIVSTMAQFRWLKPCQVCQPDAADAA